MNNTRINQILESLSGLGTNPNCLYTNQEVIENLEALQSAMARGVFEKTHAEHLRDKDIMIHFEALAREYGLDQSATYLRFKENMQALGYEIGSLKKGLRGEQIARRALKLLAQDKSVRILYNLELEDEDVQAEYDAIVLAPYGMFVIEVKNWSGSMNISSQGILKHNSGSQNAYDIPGRMSVKEALLREYLQNLFPDVYHNMLLLPSERAEVRDDYRKITISYGGGISYEIKGFSSMGRVITDEKIAQIEETLLSSHQEQRGTCRVKCDEIITDYANLMAQIEGASTMADEEPIRVVPAKEKGKKECHAWDWLKTVDWGNVVASLALAVVPIMVSAAVNKKN